ncbi:fluoride efflux transporter CrcB [Actinokineospora iranica]|uniref:Fluoride-specific ion channel FluC n=1 Tax=Actinokineospora iranica TaxID=1271860 RepID=A0A1G6WJN5_9PSEU|nr:fluoride efflux transporter CrcB [Actinokineospora iranica]SDD65989.1 CrcB protein [Actinokineospora iranica]
MHDEDPVDPDIEALPLPRAALGSTVAAVALGGVLGALARYGLGLLWPARPTGFPWATLAINVAGCLAMGCLIVAVTEVWAAHRLARPFLGTGLLGGFTTFSAYCADIQRLLAADRVAVGLAYLASTVVGALAAVTLGAALTRRLACPR